MLINLIIIFLSYLILKNILMKENNESFTNIKKDKLYHKKILNDIINHRKTMEKEYKLKMLGFDISKSLKELNLNEKKLNELYKKKMKESDKTNMKIDLDKLELNEYYKLKLKSSGRKLDFYDINNYCYFDISNNYKCTTPEEKKLDNFNLNNYKQIEVTNPNDYAVATKKKATYYVKQAKPASVVFVFYNELLS